MNCTVAQAWKRTLRHFDSCGSVKGKHFDDRATVKGKACTGYTIA